MQRLLCVIIVSVNSRNNVPAIKDKEFIIKVNEYVNVGTHWFTCYFKNDEVTYIDSFGVEHIPKEIKEFIDNKNLISNIFRIQADDSTKCEWFHFGFIDFMLHKKSLTFSSLL